MSEHEESLRRGFEISDASVRGIIIAGALVVAGMLGSMAAVVWMLGSTPWSETTAAAFNPVLSFRHGLEEKTSIEQSWTIIDPRAERRLHAYAWRDRAQGVVQIPIDRAMERLVEESNGKEAAR